MKEVIMMTKDGCGACGSFKPFAKEKAAELGYTFKIINNPKIDVHANEKLKKNVYAIYYTYRYSVGTIC